MKITACLLMILTCMGMFDQAIDELSKPIVLVDSTYFSLQMTLMNISDGIMDLGGKMAHESFKTMVHNFTLWGKMEAKSSIVSNTMLGEYIGAVFNNYTLKYYIDGPQLVLKFYEGAPIIQTSNALINLLQFPYMVYSWLFGDMQNLTSSIYIPFNFF